MLLVGDLGLGESPTAEQGFVDQHNHSSPEFTLHHPQATQLVRSGSPLSAPTAGEPLSIATSFLHDNAEALGLTASDLDSFVVTNMYESSHNGVTHVYLQQTHNDLPIVNATININVLPSGEVLNVGSSFLPELTETGSVQPTITAGAALESFADAYGLELANAPDSTSTDTATITQPTLLPASGIAREDIPAKLLYVPVANGVELAWNLSIQTVDDDHWFHANVSALDGDLLSVDDLVVNATYEVFPFPVENPVFGDRALEINPEDRRASPFGWHDVDGAAGAEFTITRGNNIYAYADRDDDNNPDPNSSPDGGQQLVFAFPYDAALDPIDNQPAAVSNLFYASNVAHDVFYSYGFDELSGNFQENNYGKGGLGGDAVFAEAQDGADVGNRNNANFFPTPDGTPPRMQMFLFDLSDPERDGDFENSIILHEYGHGVSNRLTGGPGSSGSLLATQSRGMGEGWSDFFALMLTQLTEDNPNDARTIGNWAFGQDESGGGIRSLPYSYSGVVNSHTYASIGENPFSPHFVGETWATTLWDLNWALIHGNSLDSALPNAGLGFDPDLSAGYQAGGAGNQLAMQLVMDGLKLQPANPTFLDARDAILAADVALTGGANQETIWTVFARRGMGFDADDGGSPFEFEVDEGFELPPSYVRGIKFVDRDENGIQDTGDTGIRGWTIYADLNNNGRLNAGEPSTVTNAQGQYELALEAGDHVIREVQRENWTQTAPQGDGAHRVSLGFDDSLEDIDFGNYPQPSEIRGSVWGDLNQNATRGASERGLPNIRIFLDENGDGLFTTGEPNTLTNVQGDYVLENVFAGNQRVLQDLPTGFTQTFPANRNGYSLNVDAGETITDIDFGNFYIPATLSGFVWHDKNGNSLRDLEDSPLEQVLVYLDVNRNGRLELSEPSEHSSSIGRYEFPVPPGEYEVRVASPLGFVQSFPEDFASHEITALANTVISNNDFGLRGFSADFGDAPVPYPTRANQAGAVHEFVPGFSLGTLLSAEETGQPSPGATADDDDGVTFLTTVEAGLTATVEVAASAPGVLSAWLDFNRDGVWDPTEEQIITNAQIGPGSAQFTFDVPETTVAGTSYARFRLSSEQDLLPTGFAPDGEVEDYSVFQVNNIPDLDEPDDGSGNQAIPDSYTNQFNNNDVDNNGSVTLGDALAIVDELRANGAHDLSTPQAPVSFFVDTNGDNRVNISDALSVVRQLIRELNSGSGEGENVAAASAAKQSTAADTTTTPNNTKVKETAEEAQADDHDQALLAATADRHVAHGTCSPVLSDDMEESVDLIADDILLA